MGIALNGLEGRRDIVEGGRESEGREVYRRDEDGSTHGNTPRKEQKYLRREKKGVGESKIAEHGLYVLGPDTGEHEVWRRISSVMNGSICITVSSPCAIVSGRNYRHENDRKPSCTTPYAYI